MSAIVPREKLQNLVDLDVVHLSELIRKRQISPVEVVRSTLDHIHAEQPRLNAFITIADESALDAARVAEREICAGQWRGPLHGVPFHAKDLMATANLRTTRGSLYFSDFVPDADCLSVARMKEVGAILIGKTTTPEFGFKLVTEAPLFGRTTNPANAALTCGGSSGGAAAALASGQGRLALATDGGGSIRVPAACCGVVGLKPSPGIMPSLEDENLFGTITHAGPLAPTVREVALILGACARWHIEDPYGQAEPALDEDLDSLPGLRVGWLPLVGDHRLDDDCRRSAARAVEILEARGAAIELVEADFLQFEPGMQIMLESRMASRLGQLARDSVELDPLLRSTIESGLKRTAVELYNANAQRGRCFRLVQSLFERCDVLIMPTLAFPPLSVDAFHEDFVLLGGTTVPHRQLMREWCPHVFVFNLTGHPVLSIPVLPGRHGIAVSVQLAGPWFSELKLLRIAGIIERAGGPAPRRA
jgi:aspartyl-tRNA(Asn)/glutamyl-tRNA(Gln) amidotransferase subunit A